ncbi:MAG: MBL fold metallo-hydrolase [Gemmatimonadetes bacterium]|nr:MBL fold metallo-hydrolase [Gemmatimonadota bacterium]MYJ18196.1 MBL fold metallo-hydrolase [Gemmatimonadota bacterium]
MAAVARSPSSRAGSKIEILSFTGGAFMQNTVLVVCADGRSGVLIDPGAATPDALAAARERGLEVVAILLTHAHLDHIEGVAMAKKATGAPVHLHPAERIYYDNIWAQAAAFGVPFEKQPPPDLELVPGDTLTFGGSGFEVVFAPGHAPGHVIFVSTEEPVAIVGDVVFLGSIGRTDLPGGDYRTLIDSIHRTVLTLPPETRLYTGHGPETTVGHEQRTNPFLVPVYGGELV